MKKQMTTIYFEKDFKNKIQKLAKEEYLSVNQLIMKALREYIERKDEK